MIKQFEGMVEEVYEDRFLARLFTFEDKNREEEITAEFLFEKVRKEDMDLVIPGALFYWRVEKGKSEIIFKQPYVDEIETTEQVNEWMEMTSFHNTIV